jgi:hypothetical protein
MAAIQQADLGAGGVTGERQCAVGAEDRVVASPDGQHRDPAVRLAAMSDTGVNARSQRSSPCPECWRVGDGRVVELLVNVHENGVVFDLARVNRDGAAGEHADGLAGGQVVA